MKLTQILDDSDQTEQTVQAQHRQRPPVMLKCDYEVDEVVVRQRGQQVDDEQTSEILPRDDTEPVVCEPAIVDVGDEKARDDIEDQNGVTEEAYHPHRDGQ